MIDSYMKAVFTHWHAHGVADEAKFDCLLYILCYLHLLHCFRRQLAHVVVKHAEISSGPDSFRYLLNPHSVMHLMVRDGEV